MIFTSDVYQNLLEILKNRIDSWSPSLEVQIQVHLGWWLQSQVTEDGCSLALCTSPAQPMLASPLYLTHSDFPACLSQVAAGDCSQPTGGQGLAPLLVSLGTNEPTRYQLPHNWQFPTA